MARRIVRGSRFRVGQRVIVDGDYNCDYFGQRPGFESFEIIAHDAETRCAS